MKNFIIVALFLLCHISLAQERSIVISNQGADIFYTIYGKGESSLLIINGGPGMNSRGFESLANTISDRYQLRVITYDQRGTGYSKVHKDLVEHISIDLMISDIEAIRRSEKLDRWLIFGQSFGGMLASYYATEFPGRVDKLILSSSGGIHMGHLNEVDILGKLNQPERDSFRYWNRILQTDPDDEQVRYRRNTFLASAYLSGETYIPVIAKRLGEVNMVVNRLVFDDMRSIGFDCTEGLKNFLQPTLLVIGDEDVVSLDAAKNTELIIPDSELVIIPNSGHYGWLENPKAYFKALDGIINSLQ